MSFGVNLTSLKGLTAQRVPSQDAQNVRGETGHGGSLKQANWIFQKTVRARRGRSPFDAAQSTLRQICSTRYCTASDLWIHKTFMPCH